LKIDVHYAVSKKDQKVDLTPEGFKFAEQIVGKSLFDLKDPWAFYIVNALKAKELFAKVGAFRRVGAFTKSPVPAQQVPFGQP